MATATLNPNRMDQHGCERVLEDFPDLLVPACDDGWHEVRCLHGKRLLVLGHGATALGAYRQAADRYVRHGYPRVIDFLASAPNDRTTRVQEDAPPGWIVFTTTGNDGMSWCARSQSGALAEACHPQLLLAYLWEMHDLTALSPTVP